jgi:predicted DNA-binding transcriptional regulator AlpA
MDLPSVPPPGELFIGRAQLAAKLGVHPRTVDRLRADGLLPRPARVLRRRPFWSLSVVDHWMTARTGRHAS